MIMASFGIPRVLKVDIMFICERFLKIIDTLFKTWNAKEWYNHIFSLRCIRKGWF